MSELTSRDIAHIFEALRKGLVPERGIDAFAVGIEARRAEVHRQLDLAKDGEGTIKFLRGGYGCGKTFTARLAILDAQQKNFVTSFVVVSDNDLHFHRFDDVYRKVMNELGTSSCPRGALSDILDRWIGNVEDALIDGGEDADADDFDSKVRQRIQADLDSATRGAVPHDFVRVVQTIFDLKQKGEAAEAGALISWLCGSTNVAASAKKQAGIKGEINSTDALAYLRGVLEIVKAAGYKGMLIVIDEAETILRMRKDSRHKSLNGIRQIADAAAEYHGLLWLFTGTPDFFDTRHGVAGLAPLHERIAFKSDGRFTSLRQAQLELRPFDAERLRAVAHRLRELFPAKDRSRLERAVSDVFIDRLVAEVTAGFKGDVGVVPRQFLRELVRQLDLVEEHADYDPSAEYGFKLPEPPTLRVEEQHALTGAALTAPDAEPDELVPQEDAW
ncbi:MAG: BREX system ATP-binding protein BrxD [Deltaproteobacteria bacterium]|nr:BREX system ATP-binding protein BrxD [Deltaproteobacteria bacterium]